MKKTLSLITAVIVLLVSIASYSQTLVPYSFPFIGRWQAYEDPLLIDDYGFQDIQNVRKSGKHFKGVSGHTVVNTSSQSTYPYVLNGFHFTKDQPSESHVIIYSGDSITPTIGRLYQNTTAIPNQGNFSATVLHTPSAFNNIWRFSSAPAGNMVAANGDETLIWGGNEIEATAFITSADSLSGTSSTLTTPNDYSDVINNTRQTGDQVVTVSTSGITYPVAHSDTYVKATSRGDNNYWPYFATDPSKSLTGTALGNSWLSEGSVVTNQRFHIDLGTATIIKQIYYENYHEIGGYTTAGVKNFTFWGSNTAGAFADLTYATDTNWTQLTTAAASFDQHIAANISDPKFITSTNTTAYRYYAFKFADNWGYAGTMGVRRVSLQTSSPVNASNYFFVGSKRPLQGVKLYVSSANTVASTMDVKEWNGSAWTALTVTDNTSSGGKTLAQTGTVTWASTVNTSKPRYLNGLSLYWYQFHFDAGQASIYYVTVDAPIQVIRNIWDGMEDYVAKCLKYDGTTYKDYTDQVGDSSDSTYADFSNLTTAHAIYLGFLNPQQALNIKFVAGSENSTASTAMSVYSWDGQGNGWKAVAALTDATATSTTSFSKGGVVSFQGATPGTEFKRAISDEYPLYYYKITFAGNLDADVKVSEIRGVEYPASMSTFLFSTTFQNRLFLFNDKNGDKNKAIYSVANAPDIFNGDYSGSLYFGDRTDITAATVIYNIFTSTAIEQMIVTKKSETYRLSGNDPSTWVNQKMSSNIGCVAPLTMVSCELVESADVKRTVAIWVSDKGVVMSDGSAIIPISDDIKAYWDPNDSRYIPVSMQSKSVAWYDPSLQSYKLLVASGASTTSYLNTELEYSLKHKEWTKVYRENAAGANPLQSGWQTHDTNGVGYTFGGGKDGFVYRLENGNTWNSVANIAQYLHTKDLILDNQAPLFRLSTVKYLRTAYKQKAAATGSLSIAHYGDRTLSVTGTKGAYVPSAIVNVGTTWYNTQSCNMGPWLYHSFKFSQSTSCVDGLELTGAGVYYEPLQTIR